MTQTHHKPFYWLFLIALGVALLAIALYYQYVLDYPPCVLCIHVRMLTAAFIVVAVIMLWANRFGVARLAGHIVTTAIMAWLAQRSWQLLATERGWTFGDCDMLSGLPAWIPIEKWFPFLFAIHEPCGYTPDLPLGLTMAEALVGIFFSLTAIGVILMVITIAALMRPHK
jgi:disulfide bond formation protein DsbB